MNEHVYEPSIREDQDIHLVERIRTCTMNEQQERRITIMEWACVGMGHIHGEGIGIGLTADDDDDHGHP